MPSVCRAYSDALLPLEQAESRLAWTCTPGAMDGGRAVTWLRFENWDRAHPPRYFTSPLTKFAGAKIAAFDFDGTMRIREYGAADARPRLASQTFRLTLPMATDQTRAYIVAIDRPHSVTLAGEAALAPERVQRVALIAMVLVSVAAGMLVMPFLFDLLFFLVLRERFVLLHAGMTVTGFIWVITTGGIVTALVVLPVSLLATASQLSFVITAGLTGFFIDAFLEPEALPPWARHVLKAVSGLGMVVGGLCALQFEFARGPAGHLYHLSFLPLLPTYLAAMCWAAFRGSRASRFLIAAWTPILFTMIERTLHATGLYTAPVLADQAPFFALALQFIIIALGIADRFLSIRRERDQALLKANALKLLSERDALTGLLNRRVIEERFTMLRQEGFSTLAVMDLDHFKRVNDTFGHTLGDLVLKAVGKVLNPEDEDMLTFRMGGEEFLLLLRGADAVERAEQRRQDIARGVAQENLGCLVTASMGIVEVTGGALPGASFATIYARADRLLYEAKSLGRNRMVCERIRAFRPRTRERRASAAA